MSSKRLCLLALLVASSLIIFVVDAQIPVPIPIPGVKLGLSNVVILFALWTLGWRDAAIVLFLRIVLGNFVVGNLMAMLYSMAGGILCFIILCLLKPLFSVQQVFLLSMFGALAHNAGQLAVAILVLGTPSVLLYAPVLVLSGLVTGFFTGQCAQAILLRLEKKPLKL